MTNRHVIGDDDDDGDGGDVYRQSSTNNRLAVGTIPRRITSRSGRKLVLHMDVRNTILVADSVDKVSVEQALNSFLTGVTWGRETDAGWEWYSEQPSLTRPHPDTMTYYKHLERRLVRTPADRVVLRRITGHFTQEDIGRKFVSHFERHLKHLEWRHPAPANADADDSHLTIQGKDGRLYHYILPSFYRLLRRLHDDGRQFSVVIRTYGLDAPNVLRSMARTLSGRHPDFPEPLPIGVDPKPGSIGRTRDGIVAEIGSRRFVSERAIHDLLCRSSGVCAFVDDFRFWQANGYRSSTGKPLWIDPTRVDVQHIFFDDNIRVTEADSIVDVRVFDSPTAECARSLSRQEAAQYEDMCLVQADLLQSTSNKDYFVNKVEACERKFEEYVRAIDKR